VRSSEVALATEGLLIARLVGDGVRAVDSQLLVVQTGRSRGGQIRLA
jgi:hypothetical protein